MSVVHGYARGSTHEQKETLLAQEETIKREAAHRFPELHFEGVLLDGGVSGSVPLSERPGGMVLCAKLRRGDILIVAKMDRLFRSLRDMVDMLAKWHHDEVRLIALDMAIDTGTAVGRMIAHILGSIAEWERERIRERVKDVLDSMRARGMDIGGGAPYGFQRVKGKNGRANYFVPDPRSRKLPGYIVELVDVEKYTYDEIYWHLRRNSICRPDGSPVGRSSIARMYDNEVRLRAREAAEASIQEKEAKDDGQATPPAPGPGEEEGPEAQ